MPKYALDTVGITIRRGSSPRMWSTDAPCLNLTPKETFLYYVQETKVFNRAKNSCSEPRKGKDNA